MTAQVLSMSSGYPSDFGKAHDPIMPPTAAAGAAPSSAAADPVSSEPPTPASPDSKDDGSRGRRRTRDSDGPDGDVDAADGSGEGAGATGSSRKRRRSRKAPWDRKFDCPEEGCGKSYSRAEHLYRHQLNHNPKQIYNCDFPGCARFFVRQDLCARHRERHSARGSQLLRKDTFMHNINPAANPGITSKDGAKQGKPQNSPTIQHMTNDKPYPIVGSSGSPPVSASLASPTSDPSRPGASSFGASKFGTPPGNAYVPPRQRQNSIQATGNSRPPYSPHSSSDGFARPTLQTQTAAATNSINSSYNTNSPYPASGTPSQGFSTPASVTNRYSSSSPANFQSHQNFPPFTSLPPPGFPTMNQTTTPQESDAKFSNSTDQNMTNVENGINSNSVSQAGLLENMTPSYSIPVFGGEGYSRSPFAMADDFTAWLFNDSNFGPGASPMAYTGGNVAQVGVSSTIGLQAPYFNYDPSVSGNYFQPAPPMHPMAINSMLDTSLPEAALSEEKRQQLLDLIQERFNETDHAPVRKQKAELLEGNKDDDHHVLSLQMMQTFIGSYWLHFHPQMPILHRPTFNAASCPNLLLLAMMALGASCLEKSYGVEFTQQCSELSNFLAWHLRWEIFMDADFRPPAKLWIFQALLLLEIFEKMFSTRPLHERAHIHHATTLTLMRRGSSLIGRSAMDSPPSVKDSKQGMNGSHNASGANTPDEWWNHWITNEATRRAAFAAFVMDSIHATMFGHSAVMVAHEMRLPLPCDEALWAATSGAEVGRVEMSLHSNGIKPTTFLEGLKKSLNGQTVRTNAFGRTIIMAGLLSVSWHMNQRDLQVSSLGVSQALGGRDKWRGSLTRAFDFWKTDFDNSLAKPADNSGTSYGQYGGGIDDENVFESRTVLHHLAHMAMHVDIVDCQIYAGATRLLGRSITPQDYNGAQRRMKETWAPTARARDATFYALRFLSKVLLPEENTHQPTTPSSQSSGPIEYSARDDFLLNRPWVLYFAVLIVWSYGYALDGPIKPVYQLPTMEDKMRDMQGFLRRVGGVRAPDDLAQLKNRNACLGLLELMRDCFKKTRWELLHEASNLLTKCIDMVTKQD